MIIQEHIFFTLTTSLELTLLCSFYHGYIHKVHYGANLHLVCFQHWKYTTRSEFKTSGPLPHHGFRKVFCLFQGMLQPCTILKKSFLENPVGTSVLSQTLKIEAVHRSVEFFLRKK